MPSVRSGKKPEEKPAGAPSYMLTYGDMTTLLLVFFVFLFQVTEGVSQARVDAAISSFRQNLGVFPSSISVLRPDEVMLVPRENGTKNYWGAERQLEELEKMLRKQIKEMQDIGPGYIDAVRQGKEIKVTIGTQALFDPGAAEIKPQFREALDKIAEFIKTYDLRATIEGHTDNRPISTIAYPSNWELSVGRASRVIRYLINEHGIDPNQPAGRLSASGYGDTRPVATNDTPEGRQKNRRIEIIFKPGPDTPLSVMSKAAAAGKDLFGTPTVEEDEAAGNE